MRNLLTFGLFLLSLGSVTAQEKFKAIYDYQTDQIIYLALDETNKVTDTLTDAYLKRGSIIQIEIDNVNPFAIGIETTVEEEALHQTGGSFNFGSLLGGIQNISGNSLALNTPELPSDVSNFTGGSRGSNASLHLKKLTVGIKALKSTIMSNLNNPNLTKDQIIRNIKNLAAQYDDPRLPDPEDNLYLFLETLNDLVKTDIQDLRSAVDQSLESSRGATVKRDLEGYSNYNEKELNDITDLYASLEAATFKQVYDYRITADKAIIEMNFIPKSIDGTKTDNTPIKVRSIPIKARGGFKINSSVALTLNNYGSNAQDFFVDSNGDIGATADDSFNPNLSTMINFYPVIGENFNVGGSFGLSIPIADDINGVNFLLGPSFFFGNKNRLSLSSGVAFGPVKKLSNGLEVGAPASSNDIDNFTTNEYQIGYYIGISFSLFDLN